MLLYSTNCPKCKVLERKLEEKNIKYELETSTDIMIGMGLISAPALELDTGEVLLFKEAVDWINNMEA